MTHVWLGNEHTLKPGHWLLLEHFDELEEAIARNVDDELLLGSTDDTAMHLSLLAPKDPMKLDDRQGPHVFGVVEQV